MKHQVTPYGALWYDDEGRYHRLDGPAVDWNEGSKEYYQHGKLHRLDGPAVMRTILYSTYYKDDQEEWWISGNRIDCKDNEEFLRIVRLKELL
jgi:hypothetical protein